ncbi:SDR family NAD(P)-dependent oxidoreductase [Methylopila turkensis]|uniref:Short-chain dehydrogenase n=1 Tax=Methylopila turkensis TaxID=1437816 RepID=A0A9W6N6S7_9HYPH|nr:SDR family NAD(P)-dependent oxidoreductase [Methylopila turkensis]GLK79631.1 short-chain dehydrogenase [Methylopila turkensis]
MSLQAPAAAAKPPSKHLRRYGPWALVTGASDGIGRAIAERLAMGGFNLVLVARRQEALDALAADLGRTGVETRVVANDLGPRGGAAQLDRATADLDVGLVIAAAGFGTSGDLLESRLETELDMVDLNCRAVVEISSVFGHRLAKRGRGGLVLFSSVLAFQGAAGAANYAATKAFVQTFAEGLGEELKPRGVDVLATAPGPTHTGFASRANMKMGFAASPEDVARATIAALGRSGTVRPGFVAKLLGWSLTPLPRRARAAIMGRAMASMRPKPASAA